MDAKDIQRLLAQVEHRNNSDAELLLWQKEGHAIGYPSVGIFGMNGANVSVVTSVPVKDAAWEGDAWIVPGRKALHFAKAICGEVVFKQDVNSEWKFLVHLPPGIASTQEIQERIRLAFYLPQGSTVFRPNN